MSGLSTEFARRQSIGNAGLGNMDVALSPVATMRAAIDYE